MSNTSWNQVGFFGAIEDATVKNLTLKPGKTVYGKDQVAILAGSAVNSNIKDCTVNGSVSAAGTAGGIVATIDGNDSSEAVIENCVANITIDAMVGAQCTSAELPASQQIAVL